MLRSTPVVALLHPGVLEVEGSVHEDAVDAEVLAALVAEGIGV